MRSTRLSQSKIKAFFGGLFFNVKFFTPKFMKIRCYLGIFITFGSDFQINLTIYNSSLSLTCINIGELEFLLVKGGQCTKLQHHGTYNFFEKNQRLQL
jgi:hypothetical protein